METIQNQWFTYDYAKKASILGILAKKIIFGRDGKNKPLIIWELPWNALYELGSGSNMQGWYTTETKFRTFLLGVIPAGMVIELRALVTLLPFQNDPDLLSGHR